MIINEFSNLNKEIEYIVNNISKNIDKKSAIFCDFSQYLSFLKYHLLTNNIIQVNPDYNDSLYKQLSWCNILKNGLDISNHLKITNLPIEKLYSSKKNLKDIDVNKEIEYINSLLSSLKFINKKNILEIKQLFSPIFSIDNLELNLTGDYDFDSFIDILKKSLVSKINQNLKIISDNISLFELSAFPQNISDFDYIYILGLSDSVNFSFDFSPYIHNDNLFVSYCTDNFGLPSHPHQSIQNLNIPINKEKPLDFIKTNEEKDFSSFNSLSNQDNYKYIANGLAVTKLEKFNDCPFAFWINTFNKTPIINSKTPAAMGSACHKLINLVLNDLINGIITTNINDKQLSSTIKSHLNEVIDEFALDKTQTLSLEEKTFETLKFTLYQLNKSKFRIIASEIKLDEVSNLTLQSSTGEIVKITGIIDRIDEYTETGTRYLNLIDYKTGNDNFSANSLQLLLYAASLSSKNRISGLYCEKISDAMIDLEKDSSSKFKLKGLTLDVNALKMDEELDTPGYSSDVIQAKVNKDGTFSKTSQIISKINLDEKINLAKIDAISLINNILLGISKANYIESKCKSCPYNFICK